ncbi:hypothetical protein QBC44DRAFT_30494 [Cladorrhinum sp. PSN332]|nr:hypothetical protein QBC44DRAFT_30494 [Cladorrhinum sp. PSN332]
MVRTRGAAAASRALQPVEESSSGEDSDISNGYSRRAPIPTKITKVQPLRSPIKSITIVGKKRQATKPLRTAAARQQKRQKPNTNEQSSDGHDDDDVNPSVLSAVNAFTKPTSAPVPRSAVEVVLGSSNRQRATRRGSSHVEETPQPTRRAESSIGQRQGDDDRVYDLPNRPLGSPDLGSSATKPRQMTRVIDQYEVPSSEPRISPPATKTINGLARPSAPARFRDQSQATELGSVYSSSSLAGEDIRSTVEREEGINDGSEQSRDVELPVNLPIPVLVQVPDIVDFQQVLRIPNKILKDMRTMMGKEGWTNRGNQWEEHFHIWEDPKAVANLGKVCSRSIHRLQRTFMEIPKLPNLSKQHETICRKKGLLDQSMAAVNKSVEDICRSILTRDDKDLMDDVTEYIIPRLIVTLGAAFFLGAIGTDHRTDLYLEVGTFTNFTVQFLTWITAWISQLVRALDILSDWVDVNRASFEIVRSIQHLHALHDHLKAWKKELKKAIDPINDRIDKLQKSERDKAARAARTAKEDKRRAQAQHEWDIIGRDIEERIKRQPNPLAEKWIRSTQGMKLPTSSPASMKARRISSNTSSPRYLSSSATPSRYSIQSGLFITTPNRGPASHNASSSILRRQHPVVHATPSFLSSSPAPRPGPLPPYISSPPRQRLDENKDDDDDEFPELQASNNHNKDKRREVKPVEEQQEEEDEDEEDAFDNTWPKEDRDFLLQRFQDVQKKGIRVTNSMLDDWAETLEVTRQEIWAQKAKFEKKGLLPL